MPPWECQLFFDDRLATVLRQRATGEAGLRTQFRQLLDLLGKNRVQRAGDIDHSLMAAAWLRMDALAQDIPAPERAQMIREAGWRFRNPDLALHLADHEPEVASAALNRADLVSEDWNALIPRLPVRARGFLRNRRDLPLDVIALLERLGVHDRGLPSPDPTPISADTPPPAAFRARADNDAAPVAPSLITPLPRPRDRDDTARTEISALVERIAQFRRERTDVRADFERSSPRLPLDEMPERNTRAAPSFGFAADSGGRITWANSEVAAMVIGTRLFAAARLGAPAAEGGRLARAYARRQPINRTPISLMGAPAITGDWIIDAEPRFADDGHFSGYFGRCRRLRANTEAPDSAEAREADRIRQLLHELRTPITAVQGYAEVIQQQLFGPAPHEYRALAAAIAADAARILAGFEELDRLARLETHAMAIDMGEADLAALVRRTTGQISPVLQPRGAGFAVGFADTAALMVVVDPDDAEALIWRLLASLAAACGEGEHLALRLDPLIGGQRALAQLTCTLPARLAREDNLFAATTRGANSAINAGLFGTGFALRLARAEARSCHGGLVRSGDDLVLTLPLLTAADPLSSLTAEHAYANQV